jgi:hypothetical protein
MHTRRLVLFTLITLGTACTPDPPTMASVCDGSDRVRLALQTVPNFGHEGPDAQFGHTHGQNLLLVDGQCRYWVKDASYVARTHDLPSPVATQLTRVRTGVLDASSFAALAEDLSLELWEPRSGEVGDAPGAGVSVEGSVHTNLVLREASSACSACAQTPGFDAIFEDGAPFDAIARLYDAGERVDDAPLWTSALHRLPEVDSAQYIARWEQGTFPLYDYSPDIEDHFAAAGLIVDTPPNLGCTANHRVDPGNLTRELRGLVDGMQDHEPRHSGQALGQLHLFRPGDPHVYVLMTRDAIPEHEDAGGRLLLPTRLPQGALEVCGE